MSDKRDIRLVLPETLYACVGVEANIYFDNVVLVLNPANCDFDVTCEKGQQQSERWTFVPAVNDIGEHALKLTIRDESGCVLAEGECVVRVVQAGDCGSKISWLPIGDSLTHASIYTGHVLEAFNREDTPALTLIGTHMPLDDKNNRHEGYGGWAAPTFMTHFNPDIPESEGYLHRSPFVYAKDAKPDFVRYCEQNNGGDGPDIATIFLGWNDTFHDTDDTIEESIDRMLASYDGIIEMIHAVRADTKIGALLLVPPAESQDAFGSNYQCFKTRWACKRHQHRVVERMMAKYGDLQGHNVWLLPAHVNLDCVYGYPMVDEKPNPYCDEIITRLGNAIHPADPGYKQIGDTVYCWMKAMLDS